MRWVPNGSGGYWDFCDFPLQDAEDEDFDAFPVPNPDDFDYDATLAACLRAVKKVAELEKLTGGFRTISNCGDDACQSVPHLHFHVLGGKQLSEKLD